MANGRRTTGSRLLGEDLRKRRGHRSLEEIARLSRSEPFADRVEPIAYSTLSMLERGLTMPSAQSLLTLSVLYHVPVEHFLDLVALERYHGRKPVEGDVAQLERHVGDLLRRGAYGEAYASGLRCLDLVAAGAGSQDPARRRAQLATLGVYCGIALWKLGWLGQAAATFRDVVDDLDAPPELRGWAYQNLVEVERSQGRLASARAFARDGLELAESTSSARLQGTFHATLANLERDLAEREASETGRQRRLATARGHHVRAQAIARDVGDDFLLANDLLNEAVTLSLQRETAAARARLDQGMVLADARGFQRLVAFGWLERGKLLLAAQLPERAREMFWRCERESAACEANDLSFLAWFHLLKCATQQGEDSQAAYRRCLNLKSLQLGHFPELAEFEAMQAAREAVS